VENIVSEYALGGWKLREYRGLDAEYVAPPPPVEQLVKEIGCEREELRDSQAAVAALTTAMMNDE
jgi:hypothetical protein